MISIIITACRESATIGKAIDAFLPQMSKEDEMLVACPDEETAKVILSYSDNEKLVRYVKDEGRGKPAALNLLFKEARGDVLVLSDGDVYVGDNAVSELVKPFSDPRVGAVSGHPISTEERDTMFGFWSHLLTDTAHRIRMERNAKEEIIVCSGYLYAIRNGLIDTVPEDALSEDAVISHMMWAKGFKTKYAEKSDVYVKYPTTFKDWLKQKKRSAGGYTQIKGYVGETPMMRSFGKESSGIFGVMAYPKNFKERIWTLKLILARLLLWGLIFVDMKIKKKGLNELWERVESTK